MARPELSVTCSLLLTSLTPWAATAAGKAKNTFCPAMTLSLLSCAITSTCVWPPFRLSNSGFIAIRSIAALVDCTLNWMSWVLPVKVSRNVAFNFLSLRAAFCLSVRLLGTTISKLTLPLLSVVIEMRLLPDFPLTVNSAAKVLSSKLNSIGWPLIATLVVCVLTPTFTTAVSPSPFKV